MAKPYRITQTAVRKLVEDGALFLLASIGAEAVLTDKAITNGEVDVIGLSLAEHRKIAARLSRDLERRLSR